MWLDREWGTACEAGERGSSKPLPPSLSPSLCFSLTVCDSSWISDCSHTLPPLMVDHISRLPHLTPPTLPHLQDSTWDCENFHFQTDFFSCADRPCSAWSTTEGANYSRSQSRQTWILAATSINMRRLTCLRQRSGFVCTGDSDRWATGSAAGFPCLQWELLIGSAGSAGGWMLSEPDCQIWLRTGYTNGLNIQNVCVCLWESDRLKLGTQRPDMHVWGSSCHDL